MKCKKKFLLSIEKLIKVNIPKTIASCTSLIFPAPINKQKYLNTLHFHCCCQCHSHHHHWTAAAEDAIRIQKDFFREIFHMFWKAISKTHFM